MSDSHPPKRTDGGPTDDSGSDSGGPAFALHFARRFVPFGVLLLFAYFTRPLWHGYVYGMLFSPGMVVLGGGTILAAVILWFIPPLPEKETPTRSANRGSDSPQSVMGVIFESEGAGNRKVRLLLGIVGVLFVLSILVGIPSGLLEQRTLAEQTMVDADEVEEFPQANPENPRVVPRQVADITTRGSVSYRQHRLGPSDIARMENGSLAWSYTIEPDGFRNMLIEHQRGVLVTDMTRMDDRQIQVYEEDFEFGEGMLLHRSAVWNLKKTDYIAKYDDRPVAFSKDGNPYMYYPKTGHEWHLTPFPHTTPKWIGGALVHPDGEIEHLSPSEAQSHPVLDGQRLYPVTVTRAEMGSLGFRNGIINQFSIVGAHEGEVEMARLPSGVDNAQPFVIDLEGERISYVTALEPYGEDTRGLDEVWFVDAETGEYTFFGTDAETLTGPERAMGIARSSDSRTNWGQNFVVAEPVPVTIDDSLWWHIKVSPTDFTDVTRNVFVNADTSRTVEIRDDAAVRSFISGTVTEEDLQPVEEEEEDQDVVYYILITDDSGNVIERIPVQRGQNTKIVDPSADEAQGNQTTVSG
jgi:hypothetical protein